MKKKGLWTVILICASLALVTSCKRSYFNISEEVTDNRPHRFATKNAYYRMGKSIALTGGRFEVTPGDSIVLYIEGQGKIAGIGSEGVIGLDFTETARFYVALPIRLQTKTYDTRFKAICEIIGSLHYGPGENLFVCQSGKVVVDSLKKEKVFGTFTGQYRNTSNKTITVDGPFKADLKIE